MRLGLILSATWVLAGLASGQNGSTGPAPMATALEYPAAGISLALPDGFQFEVPAQPTDILAAVELGSAGPQMAITLTVIPASGPGTDLQQVVAQISQQQMRNLAMRRQRVLKETPMPVAGLTGAARLVSYTFRGEDRFAARVFFLRGVPGLPHQLCYLLTVESSEAARAQLLPVLGEIVKTIQLTQPAPVGQLPMDPPGVALADAQGRFRVAVPRGWFAQTGPNGVNLAQTDFVSGARPGRQVAMMLRPSDPARSLEQLSQDDIGAAMQMSQKQGLNYQVVEQGPAQMAGRPAWQFVLQTLSPATASAPANAAAPAASGQAPQSGVVVQRMIRLDGLADTPTLMVTLVSTNASVAKGKQDLEGVLGYVTLGESTVTALPAGGASSAPIEIKPAATATTAPATVPKPATAPKPTPAPKPAPPAATAPAPEPTTRESQ